MTKMLSLPQGQWWHSRTLRNLRLAFGAQAICGVIGYATHVMLVRILSAADYGRLSIFFSVMMLTGGVAHLGWADTLVRFGSEYSESPLSGAVLRRTLRRAFGSAAIVLSVCAIGSSWVADRIYHRPEFTVWVIVGLGGGLFFSLMTSVGNYLRAARNFDGLFRQQVGSSLIRLVVCGALAWWGQLSFEWAVVAYLLSCALPVMPWVAEIVRVLRPGGGVANPLPREIQQEMDRYTLWIFVSLVTTHLIGNLDLQFLAHYCNDQEIASFAATGRLTLPFQMVITSITLVMLPRLSAERTAHARKVYLRRLSYLALPAAIACLVGWLWVPTVVHYLAGTKLGDLTWISRLQFLNSSVALFVNPVSLLIYTEREGSRRFAILNIGQLALDVVLNMLWIPSYGVLGALYSTLAVNVLGMAYVYFEVIRSFAWGDAAANSPPR